MKAGTEREIDNLLPCPFCGGRVKATHGLLQLPIMLFKCRNPECGAIVSFRNDEADTIPSTAVKYWERRAEGGITKGNG